MTLANILRQKLSESAAHGRHEVAAADADCGWAAYLTADHHDQWSTVAWELSLRRGAGSGDVAAWAQRVAERTGGLMEPLAVIEVEPSLRQALVRSAVPTERDGKLYYYEVLLKDHASALVRRFEASHDAGQKRQQVPFVLTNEALLKLVGDLTAEK